jgi:hypothetical protein
VDEPSDLKKKKLVRKWNLAYHTMTPKTPKILQSPNATASFLALTTLGIHWKVALNPLMWHRNGLCRHKAQNTAMFGQSQIK